MNVSVPHQQEGPAMSSNHVIQPCHTERSEVSRCPSRRPNQIIRISLVVCVADEQQHPIPRRGRFIAPTADLSAPGGGSDIPV